MVKKPNLSVDLGRLKLDNPLLTASGTFGYGLEFAHLARLNRLGGIVTKGLSTLPIAGNPPPRISETRGGMLNSIGLQNIGVETFLADVLPGLKNFSAKVIVNLFGYTPEEYCALASRLDEVSGVDAVEVNVSCPNVKRGGLQFGQDPEMLYQLIRQIRQTTSKPMIVKLSPNVTSPVPLAQAAESAGADMISAINTVLGMSIDTETFRPRLATTMGGLSGPAIRPIAVRVVYQVAQAVSIPVIGIGGIETAQDVLEFLLAGASAVQVGTALFRNPRTPETILLDLESYLARKNIAHLSDLVGQLKLWEDKE